MTALRSYDHYAPDIDATVLPGAPTPYSPLRAPLAVRTVTAGTDVRWSDGTTTRTQLLELDGRHAGYALSPLPEPASAASRTSFRETSWLDSDRLADEWTLTQVVAQGYGRVGLDELRRRLRRAGYATAAEELTVGHAIAATQAAVWHVATGRDLDARHVNPLAVSHLYDYLLARAGVAGYGRPEARVALGPRHFIAGTSAVEIHGAEVVDADGRSLAGVVVPGQRFHVVGGPRRITLRHGAVRARLLSARDQQLVMVTEQAPVVVDHILGD